LLRQYIRNLKNFRAEQPHRHAVYFTNALAAEQFWTKDELLDATEGTCLLSCLSCHYYYYKICI